MKLYTKGNEIILKKVHRHKKIATEWPLHSPYLMLIESCEGMS